jgi:hypothetical protein
MAPNDAEQFFAPLPLMLAAGGMTTSLILHTKVKATPYFAPSATALRSGTMEAQNKQPASTASIYIAE